jgi:hypothetical protein
VIVVTDECSCGREARAEAWATSHPHLLSCYQYAYRDLRSLPDLGAPHGRPTSYARRMERLAREARLLCERRGIPWNDGAGSAVHCDCGRDDALSAWLAANPHATDCGGDA